MLEQLNTTEILAALIGLYFFAAGIGLLVERNGISQLYQGLTDQPMLGYIAGILAFVVGGTIVAVHNQWDGLLQGFVSLVGWICLIEGALVLAFRRQFF